MVLPAQTSYPRKSRAGMRPGFDSSFVETLGGNPYGVLDAFRIGERD